jgi:hypothetical protein
LCREDAEKWIESHSVKWIELQPSCLRNGTRGG